jgi:(p)ppGpp synthase/HD superfamily hydrolase
MIIQKAKALATIAHRGQLRKYTNEPYIVHPAAVAKHLELVGCDDETIAAAWLHDVIEDCDVTAQQIAILVGVAVAALVLEVTDVSSKEDGNRKARKAIDLRHLSHTSPRGADIKLADLTDNTESILKHDPHFAKVYLAEKAEVLKVLKHGRPDVWARAALNIVPHHQIVESWV